MKIFGKIFLSVFKIIYFVPVLAAVIYLTLLFGHSILGPGLPGSDNSNFINLANWLSSWFPRIPFWYPQQGGGMSFSISYPILNHLIVILFDVISGLGLTVSFRIWSLITIVLGSVGVYLLGFKLTKNQTVSAIASIIYPLCPITWIFLLGWGFAAEQLTYWLIPPVLAFMVAFLDEYSQKGFGGKTKIFLTLFALNLALTSVGHSIVFIGVFVFCALVIMLYPVLVYRERNLKKILALWAVSLTLGFLLSAFWIIPFFRYQSIAAQGAPVEKGSVNYELFMQTSVYAPNVFHLTDKTAEYLTLDQKLERLSPGAFRNVSFPFVVSILAFIGLVGSYFLNRKVFTFGIALIPPLIFAVFPQITFYFLNTPFSGYILNWRGLITPARFVMPLLAGFGAFSIAYLFLFPLKRFKYLFIALVTLLTFVVAGGFFWQFKNWPQGPEFLISYGVDGNIPSSKLDLRNVWRQEADKCFSGSKFDDVLESEVEVCKNYPLIKYFWPDKLKNACQMLPGEKICRIGVDATDIAETVERCRTNPQDIPPICEARTKTFWQQANPRSMLAFLKTKDLFGKGKELFGAEKEIFTYLPEDSGTRLDIGTSLGAFMMVAPSYIKMPILPVYYNQGTLIKNFWNYEISVMNMKDSVWPQDRVMEEVGKYFGLGYMLLSRDLVPLDKYQRVGWEKIASWGKDEWAGLELWKNGLEAKLLSASTKPTVLVIGQDKVDGYFRTFHLANLGAIGFDEAILIKGSQYVDDYSPDELKNFDLLILEGYLYKSKNPKKGWKLLDNYVKQGGSLLVNTGWQYSSADWRVEKTPDFFPLSKHEWISAEVNTQYELKDPDIAGEIDTQKLGPLIYDGGNWNISSSKPGNLRSWARPILTMGGTPLIAGGDYGRGKVVWFGLDLPGHISAYEDNGEEIKLYSNLIKYLLPDNQSETIDARFTRNYPDKLEISLNTDINKKSVVYFAESYYPDFQAKLFSEGKGKSIKSYKAGPGMTAWILPQVKAGDRIIVEYRANMLIYLARGISALSILFMVLIIIRPEVPTKIKIYLSKLKYKGKNDEEDY